MKRLLRFVPACVACVGLTAVADDADLFKQLDTSGDGVVEKSEVGEERVRFFDRLIRVGDENGDGKLSQAEFDAALTDKPAETPRPEFAGRGPGDRGPGRPGGFPGGREMPAPEEIIERLDKNGDGKVQRDELTGRAEMLGRMMDRMDTDELTAEQLREAGQRMREMMGQGRPDGGRPEMARRDRDQRERAQRDGDQREGEKPEGERRPRDRGWDQAFGDRDRGPRGGEEMARRGGPDRGFGGPPRGDHPPMGGGPAFLKVLDEDGDGQITKLEAVRLVEKFNELDKNGDGKLQPNELLGGDRPMGPPMFGRADGDRQGPPRFGDRDGDRPERGRPEMDRERDGDRPEAGRPGPPEGRGFGMRGGRGGFGGGGPDAFFDRMDADGNGSISKEEMPPFLSERFGMFDKNDDGEITKDEFQRPEGGRFGGPRPGGDRGRPGRLGDDRPEGRPQRPAADDAA